MKDTITNIFVEIDDFCKTYDAEIVAFLRTIYSKNFVWKDEMALSEILTISIYFHLSSKTTFKDYYFDVVLIELHSEFKNLLSYNRFIELKNKYGFIINAFSDIQMRENKSDIYFIDGFALKACHIKREHQHKVLKLTAGKGKTSVAWFYGHKISLISNRAKQLVNFIITSGNIADNNANLLIEITKRLTGRIFGDRGYMTNPTIKEKLNKNGINIITKNRKNMDQKKLSLEEENLIHERWSIESIGNILKSKLSLEHTRHRSLFGFFTHVFTCISSYLFYSKNKLYRSVI
jgi:hypothetical protein